MSTAEENKAVLAEAVRAWDASKGQDFACWLDRAADDITMHSLAEGHYGLEFSRRSGSRDDLHRYLKGLTDTHEMIYFRVDRMVAEGDMVIGTGAVSWRTRATGKVFETRYAIACRFAEGRIAELEEFYDTAAVAATLA